MELRPPLHIGVVAIEKGAFGLPSTKVANLNKVCVYKKGFVVEWSTMVDIP